jgi:Lipopolysaccharide-assembly
VITRVSRLLLACLTALAVSGCAGYKLGPTNGQAAGAKSLQVTPFSNDTLEPRLGDSVTTALRRNLQHDGTFKLATHGDADIVVTGVLKRYDRHQLSFLAQDVLTARDYRVNLIAHVTARDVAADKTILDQDVTGYTLIRVGSDLASAERQALPLLADDLAKAVTALLVDGSW